MGGRQQKMTPKWMHRKQRTRVHLKRRPNQVPLRVVHPAETPHTVSLASPPRASDNSLRKSAGHWDQEEVVDWVIPTVAKVLKKSSTANPSLGVRMCLEQWCQGYSEAEVQDGIPI
jgi:hypothetical protein